MLIVIKVAKGVDGSREGAVASGSYKKEMVFYETLQDEVPLRSPKLLASFKDKDKPDEWFCLVMEDMGASVRTEQKKPHTQCNVKFGEISERWLVLSGLHGDESGRRHDPRYDPCVVWPDRKDARDLLEARSRSGGLAEQSWIHQSPVV